jgi:hypothetical protein
VLSSNDAPLAKGRSGASEELLDGQGHARNVGRVLEQSHVARHQREAAKRKTCQ